MPTQENSEALHSGNETRKEKPSAMLAREALAAARQNMTATPEPTQSEMTKAEALAVAWTGLEALAVMKQANLYRSPKTGRVIIELLGTDYNSANGLVSVGSSHYIAESPQEG